MSPVFRPYSPQPFYTGRTLADDLRDYPREVDHREHAHFHEHGGIRHAHRHTHPGNEHAHSTLTALPRHVADPITEDVA